jgi:hypothetical protein
MDMDITGVIEFILQHATKQELQFVGEALRRRMERESTLGLGQVDVNRMAREMAQGLEKKMGLGEDMIGPMSRRLVADMIRIEQPGISEADLQKLLDQWVPGSAQRKQRKEALPREMVLAMITQFAAYSTGEMSEQEKAQFPDGWYNKYWDAFSPDIQKLLREYIHGRIGKNDFWKGVRECMGGVK